MRSCTSDGAKATAGGVVQVPALSLALHASNNTLEDRYSVLSFSLFVASSSGRMSKISLLKARCGLVGGRWSKHFKYAATHAFMTPLHRLTLHNEQKKLVQIPHVAISCYMQVNGT